MTEKQKHMLQQALEALSNAYCEKKKYYIAANDYATAKIEDVLALEEGEPVDPRNYAEEVEA